MNFLLVGIGGVLGSLARYGFYVWSARFPFLIPSGTLGVNAIGCFLAGLVFQIGNQMHGLPEAYRLLLLTGFIGTFTTFSTFSLDTITMMQAKAPFLAVLNIFGNVIIGLATTVLGMGLVRLFSR